MAGNFHTFKLLDGYALSGTDGTHFVTNWVDIHSTPYFSISLVITGGTVAGTATLQQSNDRETTQAAVFPASANPATSTGTPLDVAAVPSGTGQQTIVLTTSGVAVPANQFNAGYRWVRLSYTASTPNTTGVADCFMHLKRN